MVEVDWRPVAGFGYEVSSAGHVRNAKTKRHLKSRVSDWGYVRVTLSRHGKRREVGVHQLVARAFLEPAPTDAHVPNHKNGVRADNRPGNLEWTTRSENTLHGYALRGGRKLNHKLADDIRRKWFEDKIPQSKLAEEYGVSQAHISNVVRGISWEPV